jgi:hypothetical protein
MGLTKRLTQMHDKWFVESVPQNKTEVQEATEVHCPALYISGGVWYIAENPVDKYSTAGWKSFTPSLVV